MNIWETREQAFTALQGELLQEAEIITDAFILIDACILQLREVDNPFARVCGLTLIKARNLALASYSLNLDGLGQEAGALLRPLIEALELLIYFRQEPSRVELAIENKLPKVGEIAKSIKGDYHDLRKHLNAHASHFGFSFDSLKHIIDFSNFTWKTVQPYKKHVLRTNMGTTFLFLIQLEFEGAKCLAQVGALQDELAKSIQDHKDRGFSVFAQPNDDTQVARGG